jgi:hypothetical protein
VVPHARRHWIDFIVAIIILWLLMMVALHELELRSVSEPWRLPAEMPPPPHDATASCGGGMARRMARISQFEKPIRSLRVSVTFSVRLTGPPLWRCQAAYCSL